jgi:hypothetical protein
VPDRKHAGLLRVDARALALGREMSGGKGYTVGYPSVISRD